MRVIQAHSPPDREGDDSESETGDGNEAGAGNEDEDVVMLIL